MTAPSGSFFSPLALGARCVPAVLGDPTRVGFEDLADVHTAGHTERVEDHVDRRAVREERHVLHGQDRRDDALVAVAAGDLVTLWDLAHLSDVHVELLVDACRELVAIFSVNTLTPMTLPISP